MKKATSGFTIVELLIVIVVIAVIASISIVAYSGVQERARNVKTIAGAREYIKALRLYAVDHGGYPDTPYSCLGEGYRYNGAENRCGGNAGIYVNTAFDAALAPYLGTKPQLDTTNIAINSTNTRAGGYYDKNIGAHGVVYYILAGTTGTCDAGGSKVLSTAPETTGFYCAYYLPAP